MRLPESRRTNLSPGARGSKPGTFCRRSAGGSVAALRSNSRKTANDTGGRTTESNHFGQAKIYSKERKLFCIGRRCSLEDAAFFGKESLLSLVFFFLPFFLLFSFSWNSLRSYLSAHNICLQSLVPLFNNNTICTIYTIISSIIHVQTTTVRSFGSSSGTECQLPAVTYWQEDFAGRA